MVFFRPSRDVAFDSLVFSSLPLYCGFFLYHDRELRLLCHSLLDHCFFPAWFSGKTMHAQATLPPSLSSLPSNPGDPLSKLTTGVRGRLLQSRQSVTCPGTPGPRLSFFVTIRRQFDDNPTGQAWRRACAGPLWRRLSEWCSRPRPLAVGLSSLSARGLAEARMGTVINLRATPGGGGGSPGASSGLARSAGPPDPRPPSTSV